MQLRFILFSSICWLRGIRSQLSIKHVESIHTPHFSVYIRVISVPNKHFPIAYTLMFYKANIHRYRNKCFGVNLYSPVNPKKITQMCVFFRSIENNIRLSLSLFLIGAAPSLSCLNFTARGFRVRDLARGRNYCLSIFAFSLLAMWKTVSFSKIGGGVFVTYRIFFPNSYLDHRRSRMHFISLVHSNKYNRVNPLAFSRYFKYF